MKTEHVTTDRQDHHRPIHPRLALILLLMLLLVSGCSGGIPTQIPSKVSQVFPFLVAPTRTPFQPMLPTLTPTITVTPTTAPSPTPEPVQELVVWMDQTLPEAMKAKMHLPNGARLAENAETANLAVGAIRGGNAIQTTWVYALVAPYPTITDEVSLQEVQQAWQGQPSATFGGKPLLMTASTHAAFTALWGPAAEIGVQEVADADLIETAWNSRPAWAIIPFEKIEPRWKVLRVNGLSPLDKALNLKDYPLTIWFGISGEVDVLRLLNDQLGTGGNIFPAVNRDPTRMTTLVMTGVTALTRATGYEMDTKGTTFPGQDIRDWLLNADLTHISNEVSFNPECPLQNPNDSSVMFCSRPEYIELLDYIGTDIVELSGNHNNDWGRKAFSYSLDLYNERGWTIFAGGANLEEARKPALVEHNGNRFAFLGCNPVGPSGVWATNDLPGVAPCDLNSMAESVRQLRADGYLPIVTFQYFERYVFDPSPEQERDFKAMVDAGAVLVSGSQAHYPQYMAFYNGAFIHYGLGNLFFDQMDIPVQGTRREFIDRHVFYDGRHISTELLTAMLEDYARPRPMTPEEHAQFLSEIFSAAGW